MAGNILGFFLCCFFFFLRVRAICKKRTEPAVKATGQNLFVRPRTSSAIFGFKVLEPITKC